MSHLRKTAGKIPILRKFFRKQEVKRPDIKLKFPDITPFHWGIIEKVRPYTMTSIERLFAAIEVAKNIVENKVEGDIVECGVWRGGSMMAIAETLIALNETSRTLYLFDTFEGMSEPTDLDKRYDGQPAQEFFEREGRTEAGNSAWCFATLDDVRQNMALTGYPAEKIRYIKGPVEQTLQNTENLPQIISILRLDTDWYESTRIEFEVLFPKVKNMGFVVIDDYGHWQGARQATDEYLQKIGKKPYLHRIDYTGRSFQKTD